MIRSAYYIKNEMKGEVISGSISGSWRWKVSARLIPRYPPAYQQTSASYSRWLDAALADVLMPLEYFIASESRVSLRLEKIPVEEPGTGGVYPIPLICCSPPLDRDFRLLLPLTQLIKHKSSSNNGKLLIYWACMTKLIQ